MKPEISAYPLYSYVSTRAGCDPCRTIYLCAPEPDCRTVQSLEIFARESGWQEIAETTTEILLDRYRITAGLSSEDFPANLARQMWCVTFGTPNDVFRHGTLSIGFIGLSEAIEVLTGSRFYASEEAYTIALDFVKFMREYCDRQRDKYHFNFSLLATSGELISGRFSEIDRTMFHPSCDIFSKGFYTNSFHVNVDSGIPAREKLRKEGAFHIYCK